VFTVLPVVNHLFSAIHAEQTQHVPLWPASALISAHKGTRAFELIKDLVLEVFGFPLTLLSTLAQHPAPWPGQLLRSATCLTPALDRRIQNHMRSLATATLLADFIFIPNIHRPAQLSVYNFCSEKLEMQSQPA
jgi:hypothetical protein